MKYAEPGTVMEVKERGRGQTKGLWMLILSVFASLASLGALVGLLATFDGKEIFDSGLITLNTVVAILSTLNKTTVIFGVSSAIAQSKWIAFSGERRRLLDFERIDAASQGPLGSLLLVFNTKAKGLEIVRIGAMLTVLAVALDPFAQQLLQYRQTTIFVRDPQSGATILRAGRYSLGSEVRLALVELNFTEGNDTSLAKPSSPLATVSDASFDMQSALMFGLSSSASHVAQQAPFNCPASNCTFPPFTSLSVCSSCTDLTERIARSQAEPFSRLNISLNPDAPGVSLTKDPLLRYTLPNNLYLDNSVEMTTLGTTNASRTLAHQNLTTLIWSQSFLRHPRNINITSLSPSENTAIQATECALYYCVNTYLSTVTNGILNETLTPLETTISPTSWSLGRANPSQDITKEFPPWRIPSLSYHPRYSYPPRTDLTLNNQFNVSQSAINSISSYAQGTFSTCLRPTNCSTILEPVSENWTPINGFYMSTKNGVRYKPSSAQVFYESANVKSIFEAVAGSMTNALRTGADEKDGFGEAKKVVEGEVGVAVTLYQVVWGWIALHAVVVVLGAVVVLWVVGESWVRRGEVPLWGSSALAVMARGEAVGGLLRDVGSVGEMEDRAREAEVVLFRIGGMELMEVSEQDEWERRGEVREAR